MVPSNEPEVSNVTALANRSTVKLPWGFGGKKRAGSGRVRRARDRVESLQMAPLSWRYYSLVRAMVPEVSDFLCAHGRDGTRTWSAHSLQLHLALGPNLWAGTRQALPRSPETHQ